MFKHHEDFATNDMVAINLDDFGVVNLIVTNNIVEQRHIFVKPDKRYYDTKGENRLRDQFFLSYDYFSKHVYTYLGYIKQKKWYQFWLSKTTIIKKVDYLLPKKSIEQLSLDQLEYIFNNIKDFELLVEKEISKRV